MEGKKVKARVDGIVVEARGTRKVTIADPWSMKVSRNRRAEKVVVPLFVLSFSPCAHTCSTCPNSTPTRIPRNLCRSSPNDLILPLYRTIIIAIYRRESNPFYFPFTLFNSTCNIHISDLYQPWTIQWIQIPIITRIYIFRPWSYPIAYNDLRRKASLQPLSKIKGSHRDSVDDRDLAFFARETSGRHRSRRNWTNYSYRTGCTTHGGRVTPHTVQRPFEDAFRPVHRVLSAYFYFRARVKRIPCDRYYRV